jgi:predicted DNA binding CopG/RHH family protein
MSKDNLKPLPVLHSDEDAEAFVDTADLSEYDLSVFKPARFEFEKKAAALNMRIPQKLLDALKAKAETKGVPFTRYVRMLIEQDLSEPRR